MKDRLKESLHAFIGTEKYKCTIEWRNGKFVIDEPVDAGGSDSGPDPFNLLLSSVASCTLITLRMYIDRKQWDIPEIAVRSNLFQTYKGDKLQTTIDRDVVFLSPVSEEQQLRLRDIAAKCPISTLLESEVVVRTFVCRKGDTKTIKYSNEDVTVEWKPEFCQHSQRCWRQLNEVFNPKNKKWINVDGASAAKIAQQVKACPSGALGFYYNHPVQDGNAE